MSAVLEEVKKHVEAEAAAKAKAVRACRDLVEQIATGDEDPTLEKLLEALANSGWTHQKLESEVGTRRHRNSLREVITENDFGQAEVPKLREQIAAAEAEIGEAIRAHQQKVGALQQQIQAIGQQAVQAAAAKRELLEWSPDSDLMEELRSVRVILQSIQAVIGRQSKVVGNKESVLRQSKETRPKDTAAHAFRQSKIDVERTALSKLTDKLSALKVRESELMEAMLGS